MYTSGSPGRPKGVEMPHGALANLVRWLSSSGPGAGASTPLLASPSFDLSFLEVFSTWCSGGALVLVGDDVRLDPNALLGLAAAGSIGRLLLPYVTLRELGEAARALPAGARLPLAEVLSTGEALHVTGGVAELCARCPGVVLTNLYGPTETHVVSSLMLAGEPRSWPDAPAIGRPVPGARLYVLDESLRPVPARVPGQLYVGGGCLARGYRGRPGLTAERFVPDPFAADGGRMYATGDVARWAHDGTLELAGRLDDQVKVRGHRVEPREVEACLVGHPRVRDAAVVAARRSDGAAVLVAYLVPNGLPSGVEAEVRAFLRDRLPGYLVPRLEVVPSLPVSPNGKVDRRELASRGGAEARSGTAHQAPRSALEERVAGVWASVLGLQRVGVHDDFFALGGDSLRVARLASGLSALLGVAVPIRLVMDSPTVAELAAALQGRRRPRPRPRRR